MLLCEPSSRCYQWGRPLEHTAQFHYFLPSPSDHKKSPACEKSYFPQSLSCADNIQKTALHTAQCTLQWTHKIWYCTLLNVLCSEHTKYGTEHCTLHCILHCIVPTIWTLCTLYQIPNTMYNVPQIFIVLYSVHNQCTLVHIAVLYVERKICLSQLLCIMYIL